DRRAAVHADGIDWNLRRKIRHGRGVRKTRRSYRIDEHRPQRRDGLAGSAVHARGTEEGGRGAPGVLRPVRRESGAVAALVTARDRSSGAGTCLDGAAGEGERAGRRSGRTGSGGGAREGARENSGNEPGRARVLSSAKNAVRAPERSAARDE